MGRPCDYTVVRLHDGAYRLNRTAEPFPGLCADIKPVRDRSGAITGWKLKPLVSMQGSAGRVWTSPAEAIAATKLMTPGQARAAIAHADAETGS